MRAFLDFLTKRGHLDRGGVERAIQAQKQTAHRIDVVLSELGLISAADLLAASAEFFGMRLVASTDFPPEPAIDERLPADFLVRNAICPIAITAEKCIMATSDPFERNSLVAVGYILDVPVEARLAEPAVIERALMQQREAAPVESGDADLAVYGGASEDDIQRLRDIASEEPVIRFVNKMIAGAVAQRASDIHVEPSQNGLRIRYRIDGVMREVERLPADRQAAIASRIKILARLNIAERRLPQDGRTKFVSAGREIDLRVSSAPVMHGESIVLRILDQSQVELSFEALGFDDRTAGQLNDLLRRPNGIVLVTGPTGSGKTTTLYAALKKLNSIERKVFSVEDPIEYQLPGVNQMQIKPTIGLDFVHALRSILRQDPDVVMIGEMRDVETARTGIQAALTGHLVLSTLHTNSAASSVTRLLDMGVEDYLLASTLSGVLAQRLVRRICDDCAEPWSPPASQLESMQVQLQRGGANNFRRARGCAACGQTGYRGRTTISELLLVDDGVRRHITKGTADYVIEAAGHNAGMVSLYESGIAKVRAGETTFEEVLRAARE